MNEWIFILVCRALGYVKCKYWIVNKYHCVKKRGQNGGNFQIFFLPVSVDKRQKCNITAPRTNTKCQIQTHIWSAPKVEKRGNTFLSDKINDTVVIESQFYIWHVQGKQNFLFNKGACIISIAFIYQRQSILNLRRANIFFSLEKCFMKLKVSNYEV